MKKRKMLFSSICVGLGVLLSACGVLPGGSSSSQSELFSSSTVSSSSIDNSSSSGDPHEHSYAAQVTLPTCTKQGYTTYTCSCGDSYVDDYVDPTGEHTYENGVCSGCDGVEPAFELVDGYLYFGEYPQSLKASDVTVTETTNQNGYYLGSDNAWYAKIIGAPMLTGYKFYNDEVITSGTEYYFKVEPIKWQILSDDGDTLKVVCASVLVNKQFNNVDSIGNNYKKSAIRSWLNGEFYNTAFSDLQQELILTTTVDNSKASTAYADNKYACENTEDKIYLLSYAEAYAITKSQSSSELRARLATDYARALGVSIQTNANHYGAANWWLRSPHDKSSYQPNTDALYVTSIGSLSSNNTMVGTTSVGVVPALQINIA